MARDQHRHGVAPEGGAHGPDGGVLADLAGDPAVAADLAPGDLGRLGQHRPLERRVPAQVVAQGAGRATTLERRQQPLGWGGGRHERTLLAGPASIERGPEGGFVWRHVHQADASITESHPKWPGWAGHGDEAVGLGEGGGHATGERRGGGLGQSGQGVGE